MKKKLLISIVLSFFCCIFMQAQSVRENSEICFNRVHHGWAEMLIPVDEWKGDTVLFRAYDSRGFRANDNNVSFATKDLLKVTSNGIEYYYLKNTPTVGNIHSNYFNEHAFTYEVSSSLDAAVSKTFGPLPKNQWNDFAKQQSCVGKANICIDRNNRNYTIAIPVTEWKGNSVRLRVYNGYGLTLTNQSFTNLSIEDHNGVASYKITGNLSNNNEVVMEVSSLVNPAVHMLLAPVQQLCYQDPCESRITPTFQQIAPVCSDGQANLPTISENGITGTWTPAFNNQATTTYTFIPDPGQCATTATMTIEINSLTGWGITGNKGTNSETNFIGTKDQQNLIFKTNNTEGMRLSTDGKVGIGITNLSCEDCSNYRLLVKDGIKTEKVRVEIASAKSWADHVFEKDYSLLELEEVEKHIREKGHLPNIPSAGEVVKNGIDVGEMNARLLEKIEELTLYTIRLNKKNIEFYQKNSELNDHVKERKKLIQSLLQRVEELENQQQR